MVINESKVQLLRMELIWQCANAELRFLMDNIKLLAVK